MEPLTPTYVMDNDLSSFRTPRSGDPAAFAASQTRTPKATRRASAMDGASQSILNLLRWYENQHGFRVPAANGAAGPGMTTGS